MSADRERILNLPGVVTLTIGVLAAIQLATELLPYSMVFDLYATLSFVPARISLVLAPDAFMRAFAAAVAQGLQENDIAVAFGNRGQACWWTPLTYALLHGGWTHLTLNCVTLAAFGTPLARRFGPPRFLVFLGVAAIAGALAHLVAHPFDLTPVVGASAAISGTMAASARFAFAPGAPLGEPRFALRRAAESDPAAALSHMFTNRRALAFLGIWLGVNLLFGVFPQAAGSSSPIAWEAHVGGFLVGLILFGLFDPSQKIRAADEHV